MNVNQLKEGQKLLEIIKTTKMGLEELKELKKYNEERNSSYNLSISQYKDGSGHSAYLSREEGNTELLDIIINTLENQLEEFNKRFDSL